MDEERSITSKRILIFMAMVLLPVTSVARQYHVSVSGDDNNEGSVRQPLRTIQAASDLAMPGDVVIVHEGVYRERINPPRGGLSDLQRITYKAANGEKVVIKGSEVIKGWGNMA